MNKTVRKLLSLYLTFLCFNVTFCCSDAKKENPVVYFASKKDASLVGSGEVAVDDDNELFFFGFSTDNETLTRYLQPKINPTLVRLHKEKCTDYSTGLATSMKQIMLDFYSENPTINPCDLKTQNVLLSLLHLTQKKRTMLSLQCINGKFEPVLTLEKPINPLRTCRFFIPIVTSGAIQIYIQSPTYKLIRSNSLTSESIHKRPQEMVDKIIKDDSNENLVNLMYISELEWLKRCDHLSMSKEYQSLKTKWKQLKEGSEFNTVIHDATELEASILYLWNHNQAEFRKFAETLPQKPKTCTAARLFIDNLIELTADIPKIPKPEPSYLASISTLFSNNSNN